MKIVHGAIYVWMTDPGVPLGTAQKRHTGNRHEMNDAHVLSGYKRLLVRTLWMNVRVTITLVWRNRWRSAVQVRGAHARVHVMRRRRGRRARVLVVVRHEGRHPRGVRRVLRVRTVHLRWVAVRSALQRQNETING